MAAVYDGGSEAAGGYYYVSKLCQQRKEHNIHHGVLCEMIGVGGKRFQEKGERRGER